MCRLFAITSSNMEEAIKIDLVDRSMLLLQNEYQKDGWGISDGINIWKAAHPYTEDFRWMEAINLNRIVIGHLRNASFGTNKTKLECHPFRFPNFIAMHNGKFEGIEIKGGSLEEPVSDSYQAFKLLSNYQNIHAHNISRWLSEFEFGSTFAFMLLRDRRLFLARDYQRTLWYAHAGNGAIVMTSHTALSKIQHYAWHRYKFTIGPICAVPPGRLYMLEYGLPRYAIRDLAYKFKPSTKPAMYFSGFECGWD